MKRKSIKCHNRFFCFACTLLSIVPNGFFTIRTTSDALMSPMKEQDLTTAVENDYDDYESKMIMIFLSSSESLVNGNV